MFKKINKKIVFSKYLARKKWPKNRKFALCLTHDIDQIKKTYQYFTHSIKAFWKGDLKNAFYHLSSIFSTDHYWTFEKIMKIEKRERVKSTFFFMARKEKINLLKPKTWSSWGYYDLKNPKIVEIIQELHSQGWEIALQASYHSSKNKKILSYEKKELEKVVGENVWGVRHHLLNIDVPRTWEMHADIGFKYDSSFGFTNTIGFKDSIYLPFYPIKNKFLVIPIAIMDVLLFKNTKDEKDAWKKCIELIDLAEKNNGILTILWHQNTFNEKEFPYSSKIYKKIIDECKKRKAWIATANEVAKNCLK